MREHGRELISNVEHSYPDKKERLETNRRKENGGSRNESYISLDITCFFTFDFETCKCCSYLTKFLKAKWFLRPENKCTQIYVMVHQVHGITIWATVRWRQNRVIELPWWSSGWDSTLSVQGAWVRASVRKLGSHMPHSMAKQMSKKQLSSKNSASSVE